MAQPLSRDDLIQEYYNMLSGGSQAVVGNSLRPLQGRPSGSFLQMGETPQATAQRAYDESGSLAANRRKELGELLAIMDAGAPRTGGPDFNALISALSLGNTQSGGLQGIGQGGSLTLGGEGPSQGVFSYENPYEARLQQLLDDPDKVQQTAGYKFRVNQGQEALQRQMAARGMLGSGNRLMELTAYGQDMASQEYDKQLGRLSELVGQRNTHNIGKLNVQNQYALGQAGHQVAREGQRIGALTELYKTAAEIPLKEQELAIQRRQVVGQYPWHRADYPLQTSADQRMFSDWGRG